MNFANLSMLILLQFYKERYLFPVLKDLKPLYRISTSIAVGRLLARDYAK